MKSIFAFLMVAFIQLAHAFPDKPIRLIVPWPAGGASDTMARIVSAEAGNILKQTIVIDNRVGASGTVGTEYVAKEKPDGYTLLWTIANHATNQELFKVHYDPVKDFSPVALLATGKYWLLVHPSLPVKSVAELASYVKNSKEPVAYASAGSGTLQHIGMEQLIGELGLKMTHVPYKGTAPAVNDLLGGHVKIAFEATTTTVDYVKTGKLRALAVASASRFDAMPNVPTFAEAGYPKFIVEGPLGILAPANTPLDVIAQINAAYNQALAMPQVRERLQAMGMTPTPGTPQAFGTLIKEMIPTYTAILKKAGVKQGD